MFGFSLLLRSGGKRTMDEADFYMVNVLECSPPAEELHQDQDLNNVALPLSCRHTLRWTCWN